MAGVFRPIGANPEFYADSIGLDKIYERLQQLSADKVISEKPPALLEQLAKEGRRFADFQAWISASISLKALTNSRGSSRNRWWWASAITLTGKGFFLSDCI